MVTVDVYLAFCRFDEAFDLTQKRALTAPGEADDHDYLAILNILVRIINADGGSGRPLDLGLALVRTPHF